MFDVTVVIPTHNRPEALGRALTSVAEQALPPRAVIVVDDVGDPRVRAVVADLDAKHPPIGIQYVDASTRTLKSASASRNEGAALATTAWIAFLDDDDWWDREFLTTAAGAVVEEEVLAFACRRAIAIGDTLHPDVTPATGRRTGRELGLDGVSGSNLVISAAAFRSISGFDESLTVWEDYDLTVKMLDAGVTLATTGRTLVFASADGSGHLSTPTPARAEGVRRFFEKYRRTASRTARHQILASLHGNLAVSSTTAPARAKHRALYLWHQATRAVMSPSLIATTVVHRRRRLGGPRHYH